MKYSIVILFVLVSIMGCTSENPISTPLTNYIPENASAIIKINDFTAFIKTIENNDFLTESNTPAAYRALLNKVKYLDYLQPKSKSILAFTELDKGDFEFVFVTDSSPDPFNNQLSNRNLTIDEIDFENSTFDKYQIDNAIFYGLQVEDKTILSSSKLLLQKFDGDFEPNQSDILFKLYGTSTNSTTASVFVNLDNSNAILRSLLKENSQLNISGFLDWISLDLTTNTHKFGLNGVSIANDSTWNFIDLFSNTNPVTNTTASFAPFETDAILSYSFDDYKIFTQNQQSYFNLSSPLDSIFSTVNEIGFIYLDSQKAVVLNTNGSEAVSKHLNDIKKGVSDFQGGEIVELNKTDILNKTLAPIVKNFNAKFCTTLTDAFVFTETKAVLEKIISSYKNDNTFDKTPIFETANQGLAKESTVLFISNSRNINTIVKENFRTNFRQDFSKLALSKYAFASQIIADKNLYHTSIIVQKTKNEDGSISAMPLFSIKLDGEIATDPQFVTNHQTQKKEIVVQDQNNMLYLISNKGKVLWKKQLEGRIQGKIAQVDVFKNGRLQLAFTTNNQLLVLDRNGKEVRQFTKTFEGGNLNPLAVFDYEEKKNYRFVVVQGKKIFMYNSKATIVDGFKYTKAEKPVLGIPKHITIGNKDFLVFKLQDGSLKLLNRVGDVRTKIDKKISFSENEVYRHKNKFTLTDKKGVLYQIDPNGKINKNIFNLSNDHGMVATDKTLVLMNENTLTIKGKNVELELGVYAQPRIFYLYDKIYISVTDLQNQRIYLFDSQAKPISGFPVSGSSVIDLTDMDNDKKLSLVARDQDNTLITYKIH